MMVKGITAEWDMDVQGREVLHLSKRNGELTLSDISDFLYHADFGMYRGRYAVIVQAGEVVHAEGEADLICLKNPDILAGGCDFR